MVADTSLTAFKVAQQTNKRHKVKVRVLETMIAQGEYGATADEIRSLLVKKYPEMAGIDHTSPSCRYHDLKDEGLLIPKYGVKRLTGRNCPAQVHVALQIASEEDKSKFKIITELNKAKKNLIDSMFNTVKEETFTLNPDNSYKIKFLDIVNLALNYFGKDEVYKLIGI